MRWFTMNFRDYLKTIRIFFGLCSLLILSCTSEPEQVNSVEYKEELRKEAYGIGEYLDGQRHGTWNFYDFDSVLLETGTYNRGMREGVWISYYRNGKIFAIGEYFSESPPVQPVQPVDTPIQSQVNWDFLEEAGPLKPFDFDSGHTYHVSYGLPNGEQISDDGRTDIFYPSGRLKTVIWMDRGLEIKRQEFPDK